MRLPDVPELCAWLTKHEKNYLPYQDLREDIERDKNLELDEYPDIFELIDSMNSVRYQTCNEAWQTLFKALAEYMEEE